MPDGRRAVFASADGTLKVWELESGRVLRTFGGHTGWINAVAVTPDGKRVVSASDTTLKVWELESGATIATFSCDASAQFGASSSLSVQKFPFLRHPD